MSSTIAVAHYPEGAGHATRMLAIAEALEDAGADVRLAGGGAGTEFVALNGYDEFEPATVDYVDTYQHGSMRDVLTRSLPATVERVADYAAWIDEIDPDAVVTDDMFAAIAASRTDRPLYALKHDAPALYDDPVERTGARFHTWFQLSVTREFFYPAVWPVSEADPDGATRIGPVALESDGTTKSIADVVFVPSHYSAFDDVPARLASEGYDVLDVGGDDWEPVPSLLPYVRGADLVVCSGYSTIMDAAVAGTPCAIVPETSEQEAVADWIAESDIEGFTVAETPADVLAAAADPPGAPEFENGAETVAETVVADLERIALWPSMSVPSFDGGADAIPRETATAVATTDEAARSTTSGATTGAGSSASTTTAAGEVDAAETDASSTESATASKSTTPSKSDPTDAARADGPSANEPAADNISTDDISADDPSTNEPSAGDPSADEPRTPESEPAGPPSDSIRSSLGSAVSTTTATAVGVAATAASASLSSAFGHRAGATPGPRVSRSAIAWSLLVGRTDRAAATSLTALFLGVLVAREVAVGGAYKLIEQLYPTFASEFGALLFVAALLLVTLAAASSLWGAGALPSVLLASAPVLGWAVNYWIGPISPGYPAGFPFQTVLLYGVVCGLVGYALGIRLRPLFAGENRPSRARAG